LEAYVARISAGFESDQNSFVQAYGPSSSAERLFRADRPRTSGSPRIVRLDETAGVATVLLSGRIAQGNSGDQTSTSLLYSGLHTARWSSNGWRIEGRVPFQVNRIIAHDLTVDLDPAKGFAAVDDMTVSVDGRLGFFFGLNAKAAVRTVAVDGRPAPFVFQDGFLWLEAEPGRRHVRVEYSIDVEREVGGNSAMFADGFGHVRNQYWWHPFFGFGVDNGLADFSITIRAPERLKVAVDLPQTETVRGGVRTVIARSEEPATAVTWAYDEAWEPRRRQLGKVTIELFATPDYSPSLEDLAVAGERTWTLLSDRFGAPTLDRMAVIQARGRDGNGWHFLSNQGIFTGARGGPPSRGDGFPVRAFFDHEVAHLWTRPSGATRNFLAEGWATYAESLVIDDRYGAEAARWFWRDQARLFLTNAQAQATALNDDPTNSGVAYAKGAWTLAMLERALGREAFDRGLRAFVASPPGRTGYVDFLAGFGPDAARAERFLKPWVEGKGAPAFRVERDGDRLILVRSGGDYWLPRFSLAVEAADGSVRWLHMDIDGERTTIPAGPDVVRIRLDPAEDYLISGSRVVDVADIRPAA
jgi:hypothetical protein